VRIVPSTFENPTHESQRKFPGGGKVGVIQSDSRKEVIIDDSMCAWHI